MGDKSTTTDSKTVQTPITPSWVQTPLQNYTSQVSALAGTDPQSYVAPASSDQTAAFNGAANLGGWQAGNAQAGSLYTGAASAGPNLIGSTAQSTATGYDPTQWSGTPTINGAGSTYDPTSTSAASAAGGISQYLNPYTQDVVNTTLQGYDQNVGQTQAQMAAQAAGSGAFGGSRSAITQALYDAQAAAGRASTQAQLESAGYDTALQYANDDANREQSTNDFNAGAANTSGQFDASQALQQALAQANLAQQTGLTNTAAQNAASQFGASADNNASQWNAGAQNTTSAENQAAQESALARQLQAAAGLGALSNSYATNSQNDVNTQLNAGAAQRGIAQSQATAPLSLAQAIGQLYGQSQFGLFQGQQQTSQGTTTQDPGLLATIGQAASAAGSVAALFSDARLKRDVETTGFDTKGRRRVSWRWIWDRPGAPKKFGVIAQEVALTDPDAVHTGPGGFLMVNYGRLAT